MQISKKTQKNIKHLKASANSVWEQQVKVLDSAGKALQEARHRIGEISDAELRPRVDSAWNQVRPVVDRGVAMGRSAASVAKEKVLTEVLPAVAGAISSTKKLLDMSLDSKAAKVKSAGKTATKKASKAVKAVKPPKKSGGAGKVLLIGIGVAALAGVAWAAWQALKADDELFAEDAAEN